MEMIGAQVDAGMRKFLFYPLQKDILEERRDGGDGLSDSGFSGRSLEEIRSAAERGIRTQCLRCYPM